MEARPDRAPFRQDLPQRPGLQLPRDQALLAVGDSAPRLCHRQRKRRLAHHETMIVMNDYMNSTWFYFSVIK